VRGGAGSVFGKITFGNQISFPPDADNVQSPKKERMKNIQQFRELCC